jgi:hypothetical protein
MNREGVRLVLQSVDREGLQPPLPFSPLRRVGVADRPASEGPALAIELLKHWADEERRRETRFRGHMRRLEELRAAEPLAWRGGSTASRYGSCSTWPPSCGRSIASCERRRRLEHWGRSRPR